jgi:hypothetical protein
MNVLGYSERGIVNALFYEISHSPSSLALLQGLLALSHFPGLGWTPKKLTKATVLLEQSLSDFGDADAILLLDSDDEKTAVFIEAKVKSSQVTNWSLQKHFDAFTTGWNTEGQLSSSNLFTQLYHKARFVEAVCSGAPNALQEGLDFPRCSSKLRRKIGSNPVVRKALDEMTPYCGDVWYLAVVPDASSSVRTFFDGLPGSDWATTNLPNGTDRWGGLAWSDVARFCAPVLRHTLKVLEFNGEQIFK